MRYALAGPALALASCIPSDTTPDFGSVAFHVTGTTVAQFTSGDQWDVRWDRVVFGFKTMTLANQADPDSCAFRGRGVVSNVVVDLRAGVVQTFNGLHAVRCPDVGVIFGPPDGATTLGPGVTDADLVDLATPPVGHAHLVGTATRGTAALRLDLRFGDETASRFAGCGISDARGLQPGVTLVADQRVEQDVSFVAATLFATGFVETETRVEPYRLADEYGNGDGVVTMSDLDGFPLARLAEVYDIGPRGTRYELIDGTRNGSYGDLVRGLFRFSMSYRGDGGCVGADPKTE